VHIFGTSTLEYEPIISAHIVLLPLPNRWTTRRKVGVITGWFCIISECPLTCYTLARNEFLASPRHMNGRWHRAIVSMWRGYSEKRVILHRLVQLTWGLMQRRHASRRVGSHLVFRVVDNRLAFLRVSWFCCLSLTKLCNMTLKQAIACVCDVFVYNDSHHSML
jgi:hypothetical protein